VHSQSRLFLLRTHGMGVLVVPLCKERDCGIGERKK
jgi:hypothetical protein